MTSPLSDVVSGQYERWIYPEPIRDMPAWLVSNWEWFDPSHARRMFWPGRDDAPEMDILVAGCGTNQGAVIAYTNPASRVVAIDVSGPSLAHHQALKERYGLKNLELHRLPIEEVERLGRDFDLIISTGVLHHLADPGRGMAALGARLRPEGVAAIMLYARYGRLGVEMLQGVFRDLGLGQDETSLRVVRSLLASLAADHPIKSYLAIAPDLAFDAGFVDTFLHGRERSYTVDDCIALVEGAGLTFQDFFLRAPYYPPPAPEGSAMSAVARLPERRQWAAMERINFRNACHFFTACRPDRPRDSYAIDFDAAGAGHYVPSLRHRCALNGRRLARHNWGLDLDDAQLALARRVDGASTIAEIAFGAGWDEGAARDLLRRLWRLDFLAVGWRGQLPRPATSSA